MGELAKAKESLSGDRLRLGGEVLSSPSSSLSPSWSCSSELVDDAAAQTVNAE